MYSLLSGLFDRCCSHLHHLLSFYLSLLWTRLLFLLSLHRLIYWWVLRYWLRLSTLQSSIFLLSFDLLYGYVWSWFDSTCIIRLVIGFIFLLHTLPSRSTFCLIWVTSCTGSVDFHHRDTIKLYHSKLCSVFQSASDWLLLDKHAFGNSWCIGLLSMGFGFVYTLGNIGSSRVLLLSTFRVCLGFSINYSGLYFRESIGKFIFCR